MSYPTAEQLKGHEAHARKMAAEYRAEGNDRMADRRDEDADFYSILAQREELRLQRIMAENHKEAA